MAAIQEEFIAEAGGAALHLDLELARLEYETLIEPLLAKTLTCVDQSLDDARLNAQQIDKVILVGGASRTPLVHRLLERRLGRELHTEVDPDLCVAMGAAVQGGLINGLDVGQVLVDITPHTLGIRAIGELHGMISHDSFAPVIHRNTPLPATRSEMFSTAHDGQEAVRISIYQGEDEDVRNNQFIGEFLLEGLCEVEAGNEILVRFGLDLNGILKVTAEEHATGLQKQLTVENALSRSRRRSQPGAAGLALRPPAEVVASPEAGLQGAAISDVAAGGAADMPPDVAAAIANGSDLISKALGVAAKASVDDRQEIDRLVKDLMDASAARSVPRSQRGGGRVGGPRFLSSGRLMPPTMSTRCPDGSLDNSFVCPVCRAAQAWSDSCRRCRCDLGLLRRADERVARPGRQALLASSPRSLGRSAACGAGLSRPPARRRFAAFAGRMLFAGRRFPAGGGVGAGSAGVRIKGRRINDCRKKCIRYTPCVVPAASSSPVRASESQRRHVRRRRPTVGVADIDRLNAVGDSRDQHGLVFGQHAGPVGLEAAVAAAHIQARKARPNARMLRRGQQEIVSGAFSEGPHLHG